MIRWSTCAWMILSAAVVAGVPPALAETKVSGTVVHAEENGRTFVIEELGVAGRPVRRAIDADAGARIVEVTRDGGSTQGGEWPGGYAERPARGVRPGDFVTVTLDDAASRAQAVEIARDAAGEGAAASPRAPAELPQRR